MHITINSKSFIEGWVRSNRLDCYGWEAEDRLTIVNKIEDIIENEVALFLAYNVDKQEIGAALSDQIVSFENPIRLNVASKEEQEFANSKEFLNIMKHLRKLSL